jgi:hypothetical protein
MCVMCQGLVCDAPSLPRSEKPATIYSIAILHASILLCSNAMVAANADNIAMKIKSPAQEIHS